MNFLQNKTVLITGGVGTVGRELIFQVLEQQPREVRIIDADESGVFFLEQEVLKAAEETSPETLVNCVVANVRDPHRMYTLTEGVDVVFHVAALKHVTLCERAPHEPVQTNILGVQNVINAALAHDVERVIFTSSDKAVNPTNVMGTSKLMGERLITAANSMKLNKRTIFSSTRFGNVLGSSGSVIPIFHRQIKAGGPVTITDYEMTRFVMTLEESCRLVLAAAEIAKGGEVFVTKMPIMRIEDIAHVMIDMLKDKYGHSSIPLTEIGSKPGEKLYEELMNEEETRRTYELEQMFVVLPAFNSFYQQIDYNYDNIIRTQVDEPYISSLGSAMNQFEIRNYLEKYGIIDELEGVTPADKDNKKAA